MATVLYGVTPNTLGTAANAIYKNPPYLRRQPKKLPPKYGGKVPP